MLWKSLTLVTLTFAIYLLERWYKKKPLALSKIGLDLFYVFSINFSYFLIFSFFYKYWGQLGIFSFSWSISTFVTYFLVSEFLQYVSHRITHSDWLWRYHMVHHSAQDLSAMSSFRYHPAIMLFGSSFRISILFLLGFPPAVFFIGRLTQDLVQIVCHCDFWWKIGPLRYIFVTPQFHRTHHVREGSRCNYGNILSFYDWAFGTYKESEKNEVYGVSEMDEKWLDHAKKFLFLDLLEDLFKNRKKFQLKKTKI